MFVRKKRFFLPYVDREVPDQTAHLQSDQGLLCLLAEILDSIHYIKEQR